MSVTCPPVTLLVRTTLVYLILSLSRVFLSRLIFLFISSTDDKMRGPSERKCTESETPSYCKRTILIRNQEEKSLGFRIYLRLELNGKTEIKENKDLSIDPRSVCTSQ